jgi:uncharacterized phage protein gp47/JayE
MPEWTSRSEGDFGVMLVELMAYLGDIITYYGDRIQSESFLATATQRSSIFNIANTLGYVPSEGVPSTGTLTLQTSAGAAPVVVPAGTQFATNYDSTTDQSLIFESTADVTVPANGGTATVAVVQGQTKTQVPIGASDGTVGQLFAISDPSVLAGTVSVFVSTGVANATMTQWTYVPSLLDASSTDLVFSTYTDSDGVTFVQFGDNVNGAVPATGLVIYATYRFGGGVIGNVAAGAVSQVASTGVGPVSIPVDPTSGLPQSSAMTGGADPESNDQIRANAPRVYRAQNRCVNLQDFKDLSLSVPGIVRANAVAGSFTSVTVFVAGTDGGQPSTTLINSVTSTIQPKALAGTTVSVSGPTYIPVNLGSTASPVIVQVLPKFKQSDVLSAVQAALKQFLSFSNMDFAQRITVGDIYACVMAVPGVQYVAVPILARSDASQTGTADVVCRDWEIPTVGTLNLSANGGI